MIKVVYGILVSDDDDGKVNDIVRWCNDHPLKKNEIFLIFVRCFPKSL